MHGTRLPPTGSQRRRPLGSAADVSSARGKGMGLCRISLLDYLHDPQPHPEAERNPFKRCQERAQIWDGAESFLSPVLGCGTWTESDLSPSTVSAHCQRRQCADSVVPPISFHRLQLSRSTLRDPTKISPAAAEAESQSLAGGLVVQDRKRCA